MLSGSSFHLLVSEFRHPSMGLIKSYNAPAVQELSLDGNTPKPIEISHNVARNPTWEHAILHIGVYQFFVSRHSQMKPKWSEIEYRIQQWIQLVNGFGRYTTLGVCYQPHRLCGVSWRSVGFPLLRTMLQCSGCRIRWDQMSCQILRQGSWLEARMVPCGLARRKPRSERSLKNGSTR